MDEAYIVRNGAAARRRAVRGRVARTLAGLLAAMAALAVLFGAERAALAVTVPQTNPFPIAAEHAVLLDAEIASWMSNSEAPILWSGRRGLQFPGINAEANFSIFGRAIKETSALDGLWPRAGVFDYSTGINLHVVEKFAKARVPVQLGTALEMGAVFPEGNPGAGLYGLEVNGFLSHDYVFVRHVGADGVVREFLLPAEMVPPGEGVFRGALFDGPVTVGEDGYYRRFASELTEDAKKFLQDKPPVAGGTKVTHYANGNPVPGAAAEANAAEAAASGEAAVAGKTGGAATTAVADAPVAAANEAAAAATTSPGLTRFQRVSQVLRNRPVLSFGLMVGAGILADRATHWAIKSLGGGEGFATAGGMVAGMAAPAFIGRFVLGQTWAAAVGASETGASGVLSMSARTSVGGLAAVVVMGVQLNMLAWEFKQTTAALLADPDNPGLTQQEMKDLLGNPVLATIGYGIDAWEAVFGK